MKGNREKQLVKNTILYAIGNFSTKILTFLIVPLYTHYISTSEMGVYDLIVTTLAFLSPVMLFQLTDGVYRWLLDKNKEQKEVIKTGYTCIAINFIVTTVIGIPIVLVFKVRYGLLIIGMLLSQSAFSLFQQTMRGLRHNHIYVLSGIIHTVVFLGLNVLEIVVLNEGIRGLIISQIISSLSGIVYIFFAQKELMGSVKTPFNKKIANEMLKYSLPLIPNAVCWSIINMSDRYIISYFLGNSANGIYSISYKFPAVVQIFTNFFYMAWQESSILEYDSKDRDRYYSLIFTQYYKFLFPLVLVLMPITQFYVVFSMDASYQSAWQYTAFLYLGTVFSALSSFLGTGYQSSKQSVGALTTSVIAAVVNIAVNIFTIQYIGIQAAAFSTFAAYLVLFLIRIVQTRKFFNLQINWIEFIVLSVAVCILTVSYMWIELLVLKIVYEAAAIIAFLILNRKLLLSIFKKIKKRSK
jgi:O-antigen/teichoic acid export membrane protein